MNTLIERLKKAAHGIAHCRLVDYEGDRHADEQAVYDAIAALSQPGAETAGSEANVDALKREEAYKAGFVRAAEWCGRQDLRHDTESPAYIFDRDADLRALFHARPVQAVSQQVTSEVPKVLQDAARAAINFIKHRPAEITRDYDEEDRADRYIAALETLLVPGKRIPAPALTREVGEPVALTVWYGAMPETNGKSNFTAILYRKGGDLADGITIDRSEYPDRVRYEADRVRHLIGELKERPDILEYDAGKHSGYTSPPHVPTPLTEDEIASELPKLPQPDTDGFFSKEQMLVYGTWAMRAIERRFGAGGGV